MAMTELTTAGAEALEKIRNEVAEIAKIDAELGTEGDSAQVKRNKIASSLLSEVDGASEFVAALVDKVGVNLKDKFANSADATAAVVTMIKSKLDGIYRKEVLATLNAKIEAPATDVPKVSDARKEELLTERARHQALFELFTQMLPHYGVTGKLSEFGIEEPTKKRLVGPRGAEFEGVYSFMLEEDGRVYPNLKPGTPDEKPLTIANLTSMLQLPAKLNWNTKQFKDFIIKEAGITPVGVTETSPGKVPGQNWKVKLPAPINKTLVATLISAEGSDATPEDSNSDEDDDNNEE